MSSVTQHIERPTGSQADSPRDLDIDDRPRLGRSSRSGRGWRSRWAAIGAAAAVALGGSGMFVARAAPSEPSVVIAVDPVRILDTRDGNDVGLAGPFVSPTPLDLTVTGEIPTAVGTQTVVPLGATAVFLNVTVHGPQADGFVAVRPADAEGAPTASNLNFAAGSTFPNAVMVRVPTSGDDAGKIEITYDALGLAGPTADMLVDVVGYTIATSNSDSDVEPGIVSTADDIETNTGNIEVNATNIATNARDIATNTAGIANIEGDVSANTAGVATNAAGVAANEAAIAALGGSSGGTVDHSAEIAAISNDISTNTADIATNTADIATNTSDIATNTSDIATNTSDIATNTSDIATNTAGVTNNVGDISDNASSITDNVDDIATNAGDIAANSGDIATNAGDIAANTADIGVIVSNVSSVASTVSNLSTRVSGLEANVLDRTVLVSGDGTDSQNGDRLIAAITATSGATAADPWTVRLDAGVFDLGASGDVLPSHVSLIGAGQRATTITSTAETVLNVYASSVVQDLTIVSASTSFNAEVIFAGAGADVVLRNLTLRGTDPNVEGIMFNGSSDALVEHVDVETADFAIQVNLGATNITIRNSILVSTANDALLAGLDGTTSTVEYTSLTAGSGKHALTSFGGDVTIRHSTLIATTGGTVENSNADTDVFIYNSHVDAADGFGTNFTAGNATCAGISTPTAFSDTTCV